ncbi:MAG: hypothetical protein C0482_12245 [Gordonia sp.]|nr:hypothetical protein [Gordonia sp. (in: high G+C Gram-positive bacteria)]
MPGGVSDQGVGAGSGAGAGAGADDAGAGAGAVDAPGLSASSASRAFTESSVRMSMLVTFHSSPDRSIEYCNRLALTDTRSLPPLVTDWFMKMRSRALSRVELTTPASWMDTSDLTCCFCTSATRFDSLMISSYCCSAAPDNDFRVSATCCSTLSG